MADPREELEPVTKTELRYAKEPGFPWPLAVAWAIFVAWGLYYIASRLVPAYHAWEIH